MKEYPPVKEAVSDDGSGVSLDTMVLEINSRAIEDLVVSRTSMRISASALNECSSVEDISRVKTKKDFGILKQISSLLFSFSDDMRFIVSIAIFLPCCGGAPGCSRWRWVKQVFDSKRMKMNTVQV